VQRLKGEKEKRGCRVTGIRKEAVRRCKGGKVQKWEKDVRGQVTGIGEGWFLRFFEFLA
jgi:hypothetical protein